MSTWRLVPRAFADDHLPDWAKSGLKEMKIASRTARGELGQSGFSRTTRARRFGSPRRLASARNPRAGLFALLRRRGPRFCLFIFRQWITRKTGGHSHRKASTATFCRFMARRGVPRAAWEGPIAFYGAGGGSISRRQAGHPPGRLHRRASPIRRRPAGSRGAG